ncbi:MAG: serine/threonine protein kinase [Longimonas sp.]|uniref:serine/threonine-protein kinase n=1 Tax=Longimonas sp. TaxID=2039626 RepID=UPI0033529374
MDDSAIGKEVDGYHIKRVIGRGGMGVVYEAEDVALSRSVAIKRVNPSQANRDLFLHRFRSEARALARIDSPHIVSVYALRETDLGLLIVMEFVDGGTLEDRLDDGPMPLEEALPLFKQMLRAFGHAHSAGVIHRDIKPQNIMLTKSSVVKVTDFGIAKMRTQDSGQTVTQGGQGGTLKYMSPEQISDIQAVDDTSDIYALGMVAYQMLVGHLPFEEAETDFDIMRKVVEGKLPPPTEYRDDIPKPLADLITTATAKQQKDRYQSTEEMMAVIEAFEEGENVSGGSVPEPQEPTMQGTPPEFEVEDMPEKPASEETVLAAAAGVDNAGGEAGDTATASTQTALATSDENSDAGTGSGTATQVHAGAAEKEPNRSSHDPSHNASERRSLLWGALALLLLLVATGTWWMAGSESSNAPALTVTTDPPGAIVYVDGDSVGTSPLQAHALAAGVGAVQVRLEREGYMPIDTTLTMEEGERYVLDDVSLTSGDVRLAVQTEPAQAQVFVDGEAIGSTPFDSEVLIAAGERRVRIEKAGYEPFDTTLTAEASGSTIRLEPRLVADPTALATTESTAGGDAEETPREPREPEASSEEPPADASAAPATLVVQAQPEGTVRVAGESASDRGQFQLEAGAQQVECVHPEHGRIATTVSLEAGQSNEVQCHFSHLVSINADPWGSVWINGEDTGQTTLEMSQVAFEPGSYEVQVRVDRQDRILSRGVVRIRRGESEERDRFSGYTYTINVEPSFTEVEYFITFTD